ncbi:MAG TPA: hypothetical protein VM686_05315 [Polyangiaceae bacterium]|nr:hypothetical protein [Polyangiaceae bacterium]
MSSTVSARPGTIPPLRPPPQPSLPSFAPSSAPPEGTDPRVKFDSTPEEPTRMAALRADFVPDKALGDQIDDLERWAEANARSDRREATRFWALRGTAFLGAAGAAATAGYAVGWPAAMLAALSALAVAIDAAWSARSGRNPFRRALFEIRELENTVRLRWDKVRLAHPDPVAPARTAHAMALLDMIQARREEIGRYVGSIEAPAVMR